MAKVEEQSATATEAGEAVHEAVIEKLDDNNYLVNTDQGEAIATPEDNFTEEPSPFKEEAPVHPEATIDANGNDIVEEEADPDLTFFTAEDFPGKQIGDLLEIEGAYYEIIGVDHLDGTDYWGCKEIEVMDEEEAETPTATLELGGITAEVPIEVQGGEVMMEDTEPVVIERNEQGEPLVSAKTVILDMGAEEVMTEIVAEKVEEMIEEGIVELGTDTNSYLPEEPSILPKAEEVNTDALPDIAPPTEPEVLEQVDVDAIKEEVMEEFEEEAPVESTLTEELGEDNSPVKLAIASELEDIYGEVPDFTYKLEDNQYNIVLSTGETIALSSAYIDAAI